MKSHLTVTSVCGSYNTRWATEIAGLGQLRPSRLFVSGVFVTDIFLFSNYCTKIETVQTVMALKRCGEGRCFGLVTLNHPTVNHATYNHATLNT